MRILVISLLRLGDFIQTVPVIQGLRAKHGGRIDVLVHNPVAQMSSLVPEVDQWWTLNRDELQAGLGRADLPLLAPFHLLKEKMELLSAQNYDLIVNLTHTRFSGYLTGFLRGKEKIGLCIDEHGRTSFHSPWFRYLDEHAQNPVSDVLNYTDIFMQACGLDREAKWTMKSTIAGQNDVDALALPAGALTVVQALTSDTKKNWGQAAWIRALQRYQELEPGHKLILLGAPSERSTLDSYVDDLARHDVKAYVAILSLDGALALLERAQLLITGDTSIKHLANAAPLKIMELSLGSSDFRRTGVYRSDNLILTSAVSCAPCDHSSACSQVAHLCGQGLSPEAVAEAASALLRAQWEDAAQIAAQNGFRALRTRRLKSGFWMAFDLNNEAEFMKRVVSRIAWKFVLNQEHRQPLAAIGSESVLVKEEIGTIFRNPKRLVSSLEFLERELMACENETEKELGRIPSEAGKGSTVAITDLRRRQVQARDQQVHAEIQKKLIRSLKSQMTENL